MAKLDAKVLRDYIKYRLTSPPIPGYSQMLVNIELQGDDRIILSTPIHRRKNSVEYIISYEECDDKGRVEIVMHPRCAGVPDRDVTCFLEQYPGDKIFEEGQPLCPKSPSLMTGVAKAKRFLRNCDLPSENKMGCSFERKDMDDEDVRKMIYDYMVRRGLHYLVQAGRFSSMSDGK